MNAFTTSTLSLLYTERVKESKALETTVSLVEWMDERGDAARSAMFRQDFDRHVADIADLDRLIAYVEQANREASAKPSMPLEVDVRTRALADARRLLDFLEDNPDVPFSRLRVMECALGVTDEEERASVDAAAKALDVTPTTSGRDHYEAEKYFGTASYEITAIPSETMRRWSDQLRLGEEALQAAEQTEPDRAGSIQAARVAEDLIAFELAADRAAGVDGDADPDFEFHPTSAEDYEATTATGKHAP